VNKVEQIKSSVILPFHSFSGGDNASQASPSTGIKQPQPETRQQHLFQATSQLENVILLENNDYNDTQSSAENPTTDDGLKSREWSPCQENGSVEGSRPETEAAEEQVSLSDLSSSFQQCFQERIIPKKNSRQSQEPEVKIQVKPFDYAAARKTIIFGDVKEHRGDGGIDSNPSGSGEKRRGSGMGRTNGEERVRGLRRHAFPASGNRSTTYK